MPSYSMSWSLTRFTLSLRDPRILAAELAVQADRPLLARAVELEWPGWSGELDARQDVSLEHRRACGMPSGDRQHPRPGRRSHPATRPQDATGRPRDRTLKP